MSLSQAMFLEALSQLGVLPAAEIEKLKGSSGEKLEADAEALARELVEQGKLTRFQAAALYQGRAAALMLGNYLVIDKLGAGGMGQVFRARHRRMDRVVALKVLSKKQIGSPEAVARFQREVKAAARLTHPHIVTAYDADEAAGMHYLVMEYVEGQDLSALVKAHGPLKVPQAVEYVIQAARGLEHAHSQGVIHRDVKPSNLLLDKQGTVKILDMGLARIDNPLADPDSGEGLTAAGSVMGTVDFMSPEQALDTSHADARSDIYSLGYTLYYLLSGKKPYDGDTAMKKILAHREQATPSLAAVRPEVSADLDAVYRTMVAKRPEQRYATMRETREALEAVQAGRRPLGAAGPASPVPLAVQPAAQAKPSEAKTRAKARAKAARSKKPLIAMGIIAVLLLGGVAIFRPSNDQAGNPLPSGKPTGAAQARMSPASAVSHPIDAPKVTTRSSQSALPAAATTRSISNGPISNGPTGDGPSPPPLPGPVAAQAIGDDPSQGQPVDSDQTEPAPGATASAAPVGDPSGRDVGAPASEFPEVPPDPAVERQAAEWVLGVGGRVGIVYDGQLVNVSRASKLPRQPFTVSDVGLFRVPKIDDDSLAHFDRLSHLTRLDVSRSNVTSAGAAHILRHPWLVSLLVPSSGFGDDGIEQLTGLKRLQRFKANSTPLTDRGAKSLAQIKSLYSLQLEHTAITDEGVGYLRHLPLDHLNLGGTRITDAGLKHLQDCKTLSFLGLKVDGITDAGLELIARLPALRTLNLVGTLITDRGVATLGEMKTLTSLFLTDPPISSTGCDKLRQALPGCTIVLSPLKGPPVFASLPGLTASPGAAVAGPGTAVAGPSTAVAGPSTAVAGPSTAVAGPHTAVARPGGSSRLTVPSESEQQKALVLVHDVFGDELSQTKKQEEKAPLAEKLFKKAQESRDDPTSAYVLCDAARRLAVDAADARLLARIAKELGSRFDLDPLDLLAGDLEKSAQKPHPANAFRAVSDTALEQVDAALAADNLTLAKRLSDAALTAARKSKDPSVLKAAVDRGKSIAADKQLWDAFQAATAVLATSPDDPDANLALGRYLCFVKGDWPAGFACLAKGNDDALRDLATKSLADPADGPAQAALGEAWADAAGSAKSKQKPEFEAGARYWLSRALPSITGLTKAKIEQQLKRLSPAPGDAGTANVAGSVTGGSGARGSGPGGGGAAGRPARQPGFGASAQQLARDRAAAEWVLGLGGAVGVIAIDFPSVKTIASVAELPPQPFALLDIDLHRAERLDDNEFKHIEGLTNLAKLRFEKTQIDDAGLASLERLTSLQILELSGTQVTDAGLVHLAGLTNLKELGLANRRPISGATLDVLKQLRDLTSLRLGFTRTSDAALAHLALFPKLEALVLNVTPVTDEGMEKLLVLTKLRTLELDGTKVTETGLMKLAGLANLRSLKMHNAKLSESSKAKVRAGLPRAVIEF